jgi:hypothetical protein
VCGKDSDLTVAAKLRLATSRRLNYTTVTMAPTLTAILMLPHSFARLANSVAHLRRQTLRSQIEVVLVHAPGATAGMDPREFEGFHSFRSFELTGDFKLAEGFAMGFRHSEAPIVAYIEDHVEINPGWAEAIVDAHRGTCAAVAPAMENANHASSWVGRMNFLLCFVDWYGVRERSEVTSGPGHNTTYKRAVLQPYADRLSHLYQSERNLCYLLEAQGQTMIVEPGAVTRHMNISRLRHALAHAYCGGKIFGANRARAMYLAERITRTLLAPLVPPTRLWRIARTLIDRQKFADAGFVSISPSLFIGLVAHAIGEVAGYWGDADSAEAAYRRFELERVNWVNATDRALLLTVK